MQVVADLKQMYGDNVVIELVTLPPGTQKPVSRHSRSLLAVTVDTNEVSKTASVTVYSLYIDIVHSSQLLIRR